MNGKDKWNTIIAGVFLEDGTLKPFMMYVTGARLKKLWEVWKVIHKYTHAKPVPVPMFCINRQAYHGSVEVYVEGFC